MMSRRVIYLFVCVVSFTLFVFVTTTHDTGRLIQPPADSVFDQDSDRARTSKPKTGNFPIIAAGRKLDTAADPRVASEDEDATTQCDDLKLYDRSLSPALRTATALTARWNPRPPRHVAIQEPVNRGPTSLPAPSFVALVKRTVSQSRIGGLAATSTNGTSSTPVKAIKVEAAEVQCFGSEGHGAAVSTPWYVPTLLEQLHNDGLEAIVSDFLDRTFYASLFGVEKKLSKKFFADNDHTEAMRKYVEGPWSTKVKGAGGEVQTFSLVPRAAHGLCFKKFQTVHSIRCQRTPSAPLIHMHVCSQHAHAPGVWDLTRHESSRRPSPALAVPGYTKSMAARRVPVALPKCAWSSPLAKRQLPTLPTRAHVATTKRSMEKEGCIDSATAPWLVPRSAVAQLPHEGLETDLQRLLEVQADKETKVAVVVMMDGNYVDFVHNFIYSLGRHGGRAHNVVVATLTPEALKSCQGERLACYDATQLTLFSSAGSSASGHVGVDAGFLKPRLVQAILELGFRPLMADLDMVFMGDPLPGFVPEVPEEPVADFLHQSDHGHHMAVNSGFFIAQPNLATWALFDSTTILPMYGWTDQDALGRAAHHDRTHGAVRAGLPPLMYPLHCPYEQKWWHNKLPAKDKAGGFTGVLLHAACVVGGSRVKEAYFRLLGLWQLSELQDRTKKAPYCLTMMDGSIVRNVSTVTKNTPQYGSFTPAVLRQAERQARMIPAFKEANLKELSPSK